MVLNLYYAEIKPLGLKGQFHLLSKKVQYLFFAFFLRRWGAKLIIRHHADVYDLVFLIIDVDKSIEADIYCWHSAVSSILNNYYLNGSGSNFK